jgi:hypothetical protein
VFSGFPFFAAHDSVVMDAVAVFAALDADFLARRPEAIYRGDRPVMAAPKKMHNKGVDSTRHSFPVTFH